MNVIFDKWNLNKGQELPLFMEKGIKQSDFVLIICSKRYKANTDTRIGGSGYEAMLMSDEILKNTDRDRFIPILLNEKDKDNIPNFLKGKLWTALYYKQDSKNYDFEIKNLLATIVGHSKKTIIKNKSVYNYLGKESINSIPESSEEVRILGIKQEEVTIPRLDGTRGSALYCIPFLLNKAPSKEWNDIFINKWNSPRSFSTMHRPGIAKVINDKILLDGTTIEEVKDYHRDTLIMCVDDINQEYKELIKMKLKRQQIENEKVKEFERSLNQNDIKF